MNKLLTIFPTLNQFRRGIYDDGRNDVDFTSQEAKLQEARMKVINATADLIRSSERLNNAALKAFPIMNEERH